MFRTSNPALGDATFTGAMRAPGDAVMTLGGTVNKTGISLVVLFVFAAMSWSGVLGGNPNVTTLVGALGGFAVAMVTVFKKEWAPVTTPLYAALEGLFLGGVSVVFNERFPGIVFNAVGLTFGILAALLAAYSSGLVRPSENFKLGVMAATGGIALVYLVSMGLGFFGIQIPLIHGSGIVGIGFSLFVVALAAANLVLDFDFIESGAQRGAPKYMEWYGAFGLMVTLVWLYLEILRLLAKLQGRGRK